MIGLGTGTLNDPVPSGTIVAQGNLAGQSGRTASGVVSVWEQSTGGTSCTFVLRLANLSAPSESTLRVVPLVNGAPSMSPSFYSLRASTGNQNYTFTGASCGASWAQVSLVDPTITPVSSQTLATATLQQVD
jgi:hypothetical protein